MEERHHRSFHYPHTRNRTAPTQDTNPAIPEATATAKSASPIQMPTTTPAPTHKHRFARIIATRPNTFIWWVRMSVCLGRDVWLVLNLPFLEIKFGEQESIKGSLKEAVSSRSGVRSIRKTLRVSISCWASRSNEVFSLPCQLRTAPSA
jgi:hypothetical protein